MTGLFLIKSVDCEIVNKVYSLKLKTLFELDLTRFNIWLWCL